MSDPAEIQPASMPADATATAQEATAEAPEQTIERLTAELAEMRDKWMRAEAETRRLALRDASAAEERR